MLQILNTWISITVIVLASTAADVLMAKAARRSGDLEEVRRRTGLFAAIKGVAANKHMVGAIAFMTVAFFTLLFALSWADVSLVVPAAASLTFVSNAVAAKIFLHEKVDRRRWAAAVFVCVGVALLAQ
jgi:drug/metabolite transporter (DMT)-like permease